MVREALKRQWLLGACLMQVGVMLFVSCVLVSVDVWSQLKCVRLMLSSLASLGLKTLVCIVLGIVVCRCLTVGAGVTLG